MERVICLVIGYVCGLFQTGYLLGKLNHIDIRREGSGNAGTTNALRVLGWKAGVLTFLGDVLKCMAAVVITRLLFQESAYVELLAMYAGVGATLGHNFPFYLKFKGGKGIAVMAGLIAVTGAYMIPLPLIVFVLIVALTRYISVGSLVVSVVFFIEVVQFGEMGFFEMTAACRYELYGLVFFLCVLAWVRHRANIVRLLQGTENKLGERKNKKESEET